MNGFSAGDSTSFGVWCFDPSVTAVRRLAAEHPPWIVLDAQHGLLGRDGIVAAALLLAELGQQFGIRVPGVDAAWIGVALDAGADFVIVPQVDTVQQAERVADAVRYPPQGSRSWGPLAGAYGADSPSTGEANSRVRCAVMIESATALAAVEEIAAVTGVDMVFVGPFDLALSLGTDVDSLLRDVEGPLKTIVGAALGAGRSVGAFGGDPARSGALAAFGVGMIAVTTDQQIVSLGMRAAFEAVGRHS